MLEVADNRREGKLILSRQNHCKRQSPQKDDYPVGLMDVISMPDADKYYRIMPSQKVCSCLQSAKKKQASNFHVLKTKQQPQTQFKFHYTMVQTCCSK
jgi:ribosomal protein S4E